MHSHLAKMLGTYIYERRHELGIRQFELADKLDMSSQFLGRLEKGEAMIPEPALIKCIRILKLEEDKLNLIYRLASDQQVKDLFAAVRAKHSSLRKKAAT